MHKLSMGLNAALRHGVESGARNAHFKFGQSVLAMRTVTRVNPFAGCYLG